MLILELWKEDEASILPFHFTCRTGDGYSIHLTQEISYPQLYTLTPSNSGGRST